ncbi:MAG: hypothetical protein AAGI89_06215 [Pseudomonadota bacterium]
MRVVVGVSGKSSSGSSLTVGLPRDHSVVGMIELLPDGLSSVEGGDKSLSSQNALARFLTLDNDAVALLGEPRSWPVIDTMLESGEVTGLFIYEEPGEYVARHIAQGKDLETAADEWVERSKRLLEIAAKNQRAAHVFAGGSLRAAPNDFCYHCQNHFGLNCVAELKPLPPASEMAIATAYVSMRIDIVDLMAELSVLAESIAPRDSKVPSFPAEALDRYRSLCEMAEMRHELKSYTALLKSQLVVAQVKAETAYRDAKGGGGSSADTAALEAELSHARAEIIAIRSSSSWKISAPIRVISRVLKGGFGVRRLLSERRQRSLIAKSGLFDGEWYGRRYPDIASSGFAPLVHFVRFGGAEGRSPSERFSSSHYLKVNPDVAATGVNPLVHYLTVGRAEGRTAQGDQ